jgi:ATP/maltotriose-dependent transcriptional regulator MalT
LRTFLEAKLRERGDAVVSEITDRVGRFLLDRCRWDEAFLLASRHHRSELFVSLVERSYEELLAGGRLPTLLEWISSPTAPDDSPVVDLVRSEVAFREARYAEAEALARDASALLPPESPLRGNALCGAGRAAYFREREEEAIGLFREARRTANSVGVLRESLRGELIATVELEREGSVELLSELEALPTDDVDQRLRLHDSRLFVATRTGNVQNAVTAAESALPLLAKSRDPLARSSFLHTVAGAFVLCGRYEDSRALIERTLEEAEEYRLNFVRLESLPLKACAELGLRQFGAALKSLHSIAADTAAHDDVRLLMNLATIRLRIRIAQRAYDRGLRESRVVWKRAPANVVYGEHLSSCALALACSRHIDDARELADRAEKVAFQSETRVLVACTRAILALTESRRDQSSFIRSVADVVLHTGNFDSLVTAYRGFPPLLRAVAPLLGERLLVVLHEARDEDLARAVGLDVPLPPLSFKPTPLSRRESEVHGLLVQGLTNREIAQTLFISESTAKVHVRNVLRKLNVRSRTEAAVHAADLE